CAVAADVQTCRQLLLSLSPPGTEEGHQAFLDDADKVYRECQDSQLPLDIRVKALMKYGAASHVRGHKQTASVALRKAIDILDRAPGDQTLLLLEALDSAVLIETDARMRSDATSHAKRALSLRQARFGQESAEAVVAMVDLSMVHATFGDFQAAEILLRAAIRIAEKTCGPECVALSRAYTGMSVLYTTLGNDVQAKKYDELALNAYPPREHVSKNE
ncbi:MAG TPA: tetratricopeptide repeat protein, partial [Thermoanaerobaculia bacterium]